MDLHQRTGGSFSTYQRCAARQVASSAGAFLTSLCPFDTFDIEYLAKNPIHRGDPTVVRGRRPQSRSYEAYEQFITAAEPVNRDGYTPATRDPDDRNWRC
jgi:hypothetical protein